MARMLRIALASALLCSSVSTAAAETMGINLRLTVPVHCKVRFTPQGGGAAGGLVGLGQIREFCNSPGGYQLIVNYTPGTLNGTQLYAGPDQVVLNGSGRAVLSRQPGPRNFARPLSAAPGANGFDATYLNLEVVPS